MNDSLIPPANTIVRGGLWLLATAVVSTLAWFSMDWLEGRAQLAEHRRDIVALEERAEATEHSVGDLEEHDHKVDLAIQRLTDLAELHGEALKEMRQKQQRRRR